MMNTVYCLRDQNNINLVHPPDKWWIYHCHILYTQVQTLVDVMPVESCCCDGLRNPKSEEIFYFSGLLEHIARFTEI